jgi:hypothetical protein
MRERESQSVLETSKVFMEPPGSMSQWLMPVILATQEAEIRSIAIRSQPRQIGH